jgi:transposase
MVWAEPSTLEVVMARPPSVFVRDLDPGEARQVRDLSRKGKTFAQRQRAQIVLASASHMSARQIAEVVRTDENQVRRVVKEFNTDGMASLHPRTGGGRPRKIDEPTRARIVAIALAHPQDLGEAETHWSLRRLRRYLLRTRVVKTISREQLRRILNDAGVTYQRTRTWKWSPDPLYEAKKEWVLAAYTAAEAGTLDGVVVSFDECGPISLRPWPGVAWARLKRPWRQRATFNRRNGVRYLFGAYDVGADHLVGQVWAQKNAAAVLRFLKSIRRRYPAEVTVYFVMDNLSTHWTPDIRAWAADTTNNVALMATPTYASHLNRVECQFWGFVEFVIRGSDYQDWAAFEHAAKGYIRRRNRDDHDPRIRELEYRRRVA